jgi:lipoate-protein ligase A
MEKLGSTWRLLLSPAARGVWNMALDEAILESTTSGESPPTLRLFSWSPPCISIGSAQPFSQIDHARRKALGWDIVRRPTGGRAILHADELTYSVTAPLEDPKFEGGVLQSYKYISRGLISALSVLGLQVELQPEVVPSEQERSEPVCFELPSSYEITIDEKKLVGSAQLRRRGGVLQHGTLPLYGDIGRISLALHFEDEDQRNQAHERVQERASTLETSLGRTILWDQAAEAIIQGFSSALGINFENAQPTETEIKRAEELIQERYGNKIWTERI